MSDKKQLGEYRGLVLPALSKTIDAGIASLSIQPIQRKPLGPNDGDCSNIARSVVNDQLAVRVAIFASAVNFCERSIAILNNLCPQTIC